MGRLEKDLKVNNQVEIMKGEIPRLANKVALDTLRILPSEKFNRRNFLIKSRLFFQDIW